MFSEVIFEETVEKHKSSNIKVRFIFDGPGTTGTDTPEILKIFFHIETINLRANELERNIKKINKIKTVIYAHYVCKKMHF